MQPTVGRIVLYRSHSRVDADEAAIITQVEDDEAVVLTLFSPHMPPRSIGTTAKAVDPAKPAAGTWRWPERV